MPRKPSLDELKETLAEMEERDHQRAREHARKSRAKIRQQRQRIARLERKEMERDALAFWKRQAPETRAFLRDETVAENEITLGRLALACLEEDRFPNRTIITMLREKAEKIDDAEERSRFLAMFGLT